MRTLRKFQFMDGWVIVDGDPDSSDFGKIFEVINYICPDKTKWEKMDNFFKVGVGTWKESINPPSHDKVHEFWNAKYKVDTATHDQYMYKHRHIELGKVTEQGAIRFLQKFMRDMGKLTIE